MSPLFRLSWLVLCFASLFVSVPSALADAPGDVATANSHLKRAEANLNLVNGTIGHLTKPPKGSAGKLAKMRLDQAFGDIDAARLALDGVSGEGAKEALERYNKAVNLYTKLGAILTGKPPEPAPKTEDDKDEPTKEPAKESPDKPKTVKLGYPHADNFKSALFTLRRVEGDTAAIVKLLEEMRPIEDQLTINHRKTAQAMTSITETRRQAGFVETGLAAVPANGEGVAEAKQRLVDARASVDVAHAYFQPLNARLVDLINPANYPEIHADVKRLRELSQTYQNPDYLFRDARSQAAEALAQGEAAKAECIRIAKAYGRLMEQETDLGKHVEIAGNGFLQRYDEFLKAAAEQKASLPADIRADLSEADRMAKEAVDNQKPMWFTGGIPQRLEWVDDKSTLYAVLDPAGSVALAAEVHVMKASIRERADSLKELIIRENPLPSDRFAGADRDAAIAVAIDGWRIQEKDFELLAVRIPSEAWSRETKMTYSNGTWYFVDMSTLQVRLIVADKDNPAQAIDRPINVRKDHQKGDTLIGVPMRSFGDALQPSEYLLRNKIK